MQEYFKILNLTEDATDMEIEEAYKKLKNKYSQDRFLEGEAGNIAAKELTKLENAYFEIKNYRAHNASFEETKSEDFKKIENLIKMGKIEEAQRELDAFSVRSAEWHYMQSVVFYKKNWNNECKKQLEISINMEPTNEKYSKALDKLKAKMERNQKVFHSGNSGYGADANPETSRQMGASSNDCMDTCMTLCCLNLMCNSCCR